MVKKQKLIIALITCASLLLAGVIFTFTENPLNWNFNGSIYLSVIIGTSLVFLIGFMLISRKAAINFFVLSALIASNSYYLTVSGDNWNAQSSYWPIVGDNITGFSDKTGMVVLIFTPIFLLFLVLKFLVSILTKRKNKSLSKVWVRINNLLLVLGVILAVINVVIVRYAFKHGSWGMGDH